MGNDKEPPGVNENTSHKNIAQNSQPNGKKGAGASVGLPPSIQQSSAKATSTAATKKVTLQKPKTYVSAASKNKPKFTTTTADQLLVKSDLRRFYELKRTLNPAYPKILKKKFPSLKICPTVKYLIGGQFRPVLRLGFGADTSSGNKLIIENKQKQANRDWENAQTIELKFADGNVTQLTAVPKEDLDARGSYVPRKTFMIVMKDISEDLVNCPDVVTDALKGYCEFPDDVQITPQLEDGLFMGTATIPVKKFLKIPRKKFKIPTVNFKAKEQEEMEVNDDEETDEDEKVKNHEETEVPKDPESGEVTEAEGSFTKSEEAIETIFLQSIGWDPDSGLEIEPEDVMPCSMCKKTGHLAKSCPLRDQRAEQDKNRRDNKPPQRKFRCRQCGSVGVGCSARSCINDDVIENGELPIQRHGAARRPSRTRPSADESSFEAESWVTSSPKRSRKNKKSRLDQPYEHNMNNVTVRKPKKRSGILRNTLEEPIVINDDKDATAGFPGANAGQLGLPSLQYASQGEVLQAQTGQLGSSAFPLSINKFAMPKGAAGQQVTNTAAAVAAAV